MILFANFLMRVMAKAGLDALANLRGSGDTRGYSERMASWADRQNLFALPALDALDAELARDAAVLAAKAAGKVPETPET